MVSWNARALTHGNLSRRRRKVRVLESLMSRATVVSLQETHGTLQDLRSCLHRLRGEWHVFHSGGVDRTAGGVATLVRKEVAPLLADVSVCARVPGRVLRIRIRRGDRSCCLWNVHNYGLTPVQAAATAAEIGVDCDRARGNPLSHVSWVVGDWNFHAPGEARRKIARPLEPVDLTVLPPQLCFHQRTFQSVLGSLVEIQSTAPTHFSPDSFSLGRLDRIYTSVPAWALCAAGHAVGHHDDPIRMHRSGVSDHAPVCASLSVRKFLPRAERPIPREIFDYPRFQEAHNALCAAARLDSFPVVERWTLHKVIIREAATIVADELRVIDVDSPFAMNLAVSAIARCVWNGSSQVARTLMARCPLAADHITIGNEPGCVMLVDPLGFARVAESVRRDWHEYQASRIDQDFPEAGEGRFASAAKKKSKKSALARVAKLWSPLDKRLVLKGVRVLSSCGVGPAVARSSQEQAEALSKAWAPTFEAKAVDPAKGDALLDRWGGSFDFSLARPPCPRDFHEFLSRVGHSAPGRDGIPYGGWKATGEWGLCTLSLLCDSLLSGYLLPVSFNDSLTVFVPKGMEQDDETGIVRDPLDTRPLALNNSDNKAIGGVVNFLLKRTMARSACALQRGFIPGRQLLENVLNLDTHARAQGMRDGGCRIPILAFWDYAAAFPSVAHAWLFRALASAGAPDGLLSLVRGMYNFNCGYFCCDGKVFLLFCITGGVLQGCPLSGMLFAFAIDPVLRRFEGEVCAAGKGEVKACADDIGAALRSIVGLKVAKSIFDDAAEATNLRLKPAKCVLVPSGARLDRRLLARIKGWLHRNLPEWSNFVVCAAGKYLGFMMGPKAGQVLWNATLAKWKDRAVAVARTQSAASVSSFLYNNRALPVLGYVAQLAELPESFARAEKVVVHHLLHVAMNSMDAATPFNLQSVGGPRIVSAKVMATATMIRTAIRTLPGWPEQKAILADAALEHLPYVRTMSGETWPVCWDSPAFATNLSHAHEGFPGRGALHEGATRALHVIRGMPPGATGIQRVAMKPLLSALYPPRLEPLFAKRLSALFPEIVLTIRDVQWENVLKVLKKLSPHPAMCVVKSYLNAWATSERFHEEKRLPCVLGCAPAADTLSHYLVCDRLWRIVNDSVAGDVSADTAGRLGISRPSATRMLDLAVAFSTYHAVKVTERDLVERAVGSGRFDEVFHVAGNHARVASLSLGRSRAMRVGRRDS